MEILDQQSVRPASLVVVDNAPDETNRAIVLGSDLGGAEVAYLPMKENAGPAGGIAAGMRQVLNYAAPEDWIVLFDDDDPPRDDELLARIVDLAERAMFFDSAVGGVGMAGALFDQKIGRVVRIPNSDLIELVSLDWIGGNMFPTYRVSTVRKVGPFDEDLFFGFDDLEFGLRLKDAGHSIYADGDAWKERRERLGLTKPSPRPNRTLVSPSWRRYYSLRNLIAITRARSTSTAIRVAIVVGLAKPLGGMIRQPAAAVANLRMNFRAISDGWRGRMGRTVEPLAEDWEQ
jgi:glycosyltransferase involved in cell wall biosynthesis